MSHFTPERDRALFGCQCTRSGCDAPPVSDTLVARLNMLRDRLGRPLVVTSGPRCEYWNKKQGGKPNSDHRTGDGADLACVTSAQRDELLECIYRQPRLFHRVGIGPNFIHVGLTTHNAGRVTWTYYGS